MIIAQISDTHIAGWGKKTYGIAPMVENLSQCIAHINQLNPEPDVVVVTGDITSSGTVEEFEQAASLLNKLNAPCYAIPGNHDNKANFLSAFAGVTCFSTNLGNDPQQEFINYVINDYDLRLIAMDSTIINKAGGEICAMRASWLNDRLAEDRQKPTIIFMHHPPLKLSVRETDCDGFIGTDRLGKIIEKYANIERILCGHVHLPTFSRWHGTIVSTAPSMGMRLVLDLKMEQPSQFVLEEPAYQLHHWTAENNLITHSISVKTINKNYRFESYANEDRQG